MSIGIGRNHAINMLRGEAAILARDIDESLGQGFVEGRREAWVQSIIDDYDVSLSDLADVLQALTGVDPPTSITREHAVRRLAALIDE